MNLKRHQLKLKNHLKDKWIKDHISICVKQEYREDFVRKIVKNSILVETINMGNQFGGGDAGLGNLKNIAPMDSKDVMMYVDHKRLCNVR